MTTPLPPLPKTDLGLCFFDEDGAHPCDGNGYTAKQMQAYAAQARADLEAENKRLREALKDVGLFLHHCWCDVQMNDYSFEKLTKQMEAVDAAVEKKP